MIKFLFILLFPIVCEAQKSNNEWIKFAPDTVKRDTVWLPDFITNVQTADFRDSLVYDEKAFKVFTAKLIAATRKKTIDSLRKKSK